MNYLKKFRFLFTSLLTTFSMVPLTLAVCPMDLGYVLTIAWNTSSCQNHSTPSSSQNDSCCQTLFSLYGIAFAQRLKATNLFELPDLDTSISCLQSFQSKLDSLTLPPNAASSCFAPSQFVISQNSCASIASTTDWVSHLSLAPTTDLNSSCSSDLTDLSNCTSCREAVFEVRDNLINIGNNTSQSDDSIAKEECWYFTILYAAGIINSLGPLSPGALTCIFNLPIKPQPQPQGGGLTWQLKLVIAAGTAIFMSAVFFLITRIRKLILWNRQSKGHQDIEDFIKNYGSLVPKRFRYLEVKRMTNSFKEKLGQGGFGAVYKGNLPNGTQVAVKLLHELKGDGEDFINEVASISRTSHVNIVTLLGFCFKGHRRALVYEFMPNQSLDKFICNEIPGGTRLGLERLHQIAVGTARGLEYLHRGCKTRILHFDIKPQNILLDDDFCPKISDFGLSKLCLKKESILSTLTTRGTIGYIAPEVFSKNFGGVSHKSDVYSYGMMLIDMVGGRKKLNEGEERSSQMYFPDRVYRLLEQHNVLGVLHDQIIPEENEIARKMIAVGLWCIQTVPSERPSMTRVIELLEGSIEAMQMPPKPYLFSVPRSSPLQSTSESL